MPRSGGSGDASPEPGHRGPGRAPALARPETRASHNNAFAVRFGHAGVLVAAALAGALAGCSRLPPTVTPTPGEVVPTEDTTAEALTLEVQNLEPAVGLERIHFKLRDSGGATVDASAKVETTFYRVGPSGEATAAASGPAVYFGGSLPDGGSWVVYGTFDASGVWGLEAVADWDGRHGRGRVDIDVVPRPSAPKSGDRPPFTDTPKAAPESLATITSDPDPDPDLYAHTLAEAIAIGRPIVVHFSSPAHCPGSDCERPLTEVKAVKGSYAGRVTFLHVETHDPANPAVQSSAARAWGLPSEPWTFILDHTGAVAVRLEGIIDRVELGLLLDRELAKPGAGG